MSRCFENLAQFSNSTVQLTRCGQMPPIQCGSDFSGRQLSPCAREHVNGFGTSHPVQGVITVARAEKVALR